MGHDARETAPEAVSELRQVRGRTSPEVRFRRWSRGRTQLRLRQVVPGFVLRP